MPAAGAGLLQGAASVWLPAIGLMLYVWRQRPAQFAEPAVDDLSYGVVTVAVYDWLRQRREYPVGVG